MEGGERGCGHAGGRTRLRGVRNSLKSGLDLSSLKLRHADRVLPSHLGSEKEEIKSGLDGVSPHHFLERQKEEWIGSGTVGPACKSGDIGGSSTFVVGSARQTGWSSFGPSSARRSFDVRLSRTRRRTKTHQGRTRKTLTISRKRPQARMGSPPFLQIGSVSALLFPNK